MDETSPLMSQLREIASNTWSHGKLCGWLQEKRYDVDAVVILLEEVKAGRVTWQQVDADKPDEGSFLIDGTKRLPSKMMWILNVADCIDFGEKVPLDASDKHTLFYRCGIIQPLGEELITNYGDETRARSEWTSTS